MENRKKYYGYIDRFIIRFVHWMYGDALNNKEIYHEQISPKKNNRRNVSQTFNA